MKKKILIPTDFSDNAWNATAYALQLYKGIVCEFYLVNAYNNKVPSKGDLIKENAGSLSFQGEKMKSEQGLQTILQRIQSLENNDKHTFSLHSIQDDTLSAIKTLVAKRDVEMVIMGTKGASNYKNKAFGSHTINVMENLTICPIIGVPYDAEEVDIKDIVFSTSFKTHYKRREFSHLVELATVHEANISILHVNDNNSLSKTQIESKQLLEECLEGVSYNFHEVKNSNVAVAVKGFVSGSNCDMIAFINRKHSFFSTLFNTPMVQELGMFSKVPLFIMHEIRV
jgi:nucleotide-binding universal stress UspA family protein